MRRPAPRHKWLFYFVLVWVVVVLALAGKKIVSDLESSVFLNRPWRKNIVLYTQPPTLISFPHEKDEQLMIITLPENLYVRVPYGYGHYRLGAVWRLGKLEQKPFLYLESLEDTLAVKVQGYVGKEEPIQITEGTQTILESIKDNFELSKLLTQSFHTNLNTLDRFLVGYQLVQARGERIPIFQIETDDRLFTKTTLPDGTEIKLTNEKALDRSLAQKFEDTTVRKQDLSIAIKNGTDTANIASGFSRYVSTMGGKVIATTSESSSVSACTIETKKNHLKEKIVLYLEKEFDCLTQIIDTEHGVDVEVTLGSYFEERWK